jgi:hypothetical protein
MANQITRPANRQEFMDKLVMPYLPTAPKADPVFSQPEKLGQPEINRALEISVKKDTDKDFSIGIQDFDEALKYYFDNVLKLNVTQNGSRVEVPVFYGNQESWKDIQLEGYMRDKAGKMLAPALFFRRTGIEQNRNLGFKLDGNSAHNLQYFEGSYDKRNIYSNFNVLNSRVPTKKYMVSVTPDYVTVTYSCVVWTYFVEQMDKLIESLNFASRSYWGDPNKFLFYTQIDSFEETLQYNTGTDRSVRNQFTLKLNGYLIPDSVNAKVAAGNRVFSVANISFGMEVANSREQFQANLAKPKSSTIAVVAANDSVNITNNNIIQGTGLPAAVSAYLVQSKQIQGTYVSTNSIIFASSWAVPPSGYNLPNNDITNFNFFVNSTLIDPGAITSFVDNNNGTSTLTVNTSTLGFGFDSQDTVYAIGKFA